MKQYSSLLRSITCIASFTVLAATSVWAEDSDFSRAGRWELGLPGKYWMGSDVISSAIGTGAMIGYNFDDHWNVNLEAYCGLRLETEVDGVDGKGSIYTAILNVEYYFKPGRFSPFVTASGGVFNYDSKETFDGPSAFSVAETGLSYGGGAGVRWEISKHWFVKGAYHFFGTTADGVDYMHGPEITIGWLF